MNDLNPLLQSTIILVFRFCSKQFTKISYVLNPKGCSNNNVLNNGSSNLQHGGIFFQSPFHVLFQIISSNEATWIKCPYNDSLTHWSVASGIDAVNIILCEPNITSFSSKDIASYLWYDIIWSSVRERFHQVDGISSVE